MRIKCILFDVDDTLYDATLQTNMARLNAVKAMIEAGLPVDIETAYEALRGIVDKYGPYYNKHFDKLLEHLGLKWSPRIIAAGVIAYRETSAAYLRPYPDTVPTLLKLRESGYLLGAISEGRSVKQWQKLIQLGIQHLFHSAAISEEINEEKVTPKLFEKILGELKVSPQETLFVGNQLDTDILSANQLSIISVRIRKGVFMTEEPKDPKMVPKFEISKLSDILEILGKLQK
ncbi:MAG: TIGR02253 family HAD-type hydrolase [Candidatus Bathyarchaeia archaeon]